MDLELEEILGQDNSDKYQSYIYTNFSSYEALLKTFTLRDSYIIDCDRAQAAYSRIDSKHNGEGALVGATSSLLDRLEDDGPVKVSQLGIFVLILLNPYLMHPEHQSLLMPRLCTLLMDLSSKDKIELQFIIKESAQKTTESNIPNTALSPESPLHQQASSGQSALIFQKMVAVFQQFITLRMLTKSEDIPAFKDDSIVRASQCLEILYNVNEVEHFIPYYEFHNDVIENSLDLKEEYPRWKGKEGFSFCECPYLLSTTAKSELLRIECLLHMRHELQDAFFRTLFIGVNSPYLQLEIRRTNVIRDALFQLEGKSTHDLKKQLRVSFVGEEGIDEGGVQKEFFQIIVKDMFDSSYGMFMVNDDSRLCWFVNDQINDPDTMQEYNLIGRLIGLAIYNGVILDIHFPLALYKKIFGYPMTLDDLKEIDPMLARGLEQLLSFDGDVADTFERSFQIEYKTPSGQTTLIDLCEDGANIRVDHINRKEFVDLYVDFYFNKSVFQQFQAFQDGFNHVMAGSALKLFRPEELQEIICGSPNLDFEALENSTQYDGYDKDSTTVKDFWVLVHNMSIEEKKRLLFFTTGSDRVPVGGLAKLNFIIARNGKDSDRLPTSHTCYNVLLLPEYDTVERLKDRVMTALNNSNCGFFLN